MFIYLIVNHDTGKYYVGQHKGNNLNKYLQQKFHHAQRGISENSRLFRSMRKHPASSTWSIHALRSGIQTKEELNQTEQDFIKFLRSQDSEYGYNIRQGGEGLTSEDAKRVAKNRLADPQFSYRLSEALKKAWASPDTYVKHSDSAKKSWLNPEIRDKIFKGLRSPEAVSKKSKSTKNRFSTLEARIKQSEAVKTGRWSSLELLTKQSEFAKGLWLNPETRIKMVEGVQKRATTSSRLGGQIQGQRNAKSGVLAKAGCQRWNINRGKACICGFHLTPAN